MAAPDLRRASAAAWRAFLVLGLAMPALSGCSGGSFTVDVPLWKSGFAWQYDALQSVSTHVKGTPPANVEDLGEQGERTLNQTQRFEVFNSTASSVEGIPIYAVAVLQHTLADENNSIEENEIWDAWIYSADLNYVEPTYLDWRNQEVQLSGDQGGAQDSPSPSAGSPVNDSEFNKPQNELRRLDWPLTKGHVWRHLENVPFLDIEGVFEGKAVKTQKVKVPAGEFTAVRIKGTLEPVDLGEIEDAIQSSLESQGGEVKSIDFSFKVEFDYAFGEAVLNFVDFKQVQRLTLSARGTDGDGQDYDFTFTQTTTYANVLASYQLIEIVEKPLSFAVDVKRGVYSPKPITPASHLAVEVLATQIDINRVDSDDRFSLGVRIYNSTAGEKRLRDPEASYPAKTGDNEFSPKYDHDMLEVVWSLNHIDQKGRKFEFKHAIADRLDLKGVDFPSDGLKSVQATLKLKDGPDGPGQEIFTDTVLIEVYYHTNQTYERQAQNVTPTSTILVRFPVEAGGTRVGINGVLANAPTADSQCAVAGTQGGQGGQGDCLRVLDAARRPVSDERSQRMVFETTQVSRYAVGSWSVEYFPSAPGQKVTFDIVVRYRAGQ